MKKGLKGLKCLVGALCAVTAVSGIYFAKTYDVNDVEAEDIVFSKPIEDVYAVGTTLEIPSAEFVTEDGNLIAKATVIAPSGKAYSSNSVSLSEAGIYTVEYTAEKDGRLFEEVKTFTVKNELFTIVGDASSAEYGEAYNHEGLKVSLAEKETLVFNTVIDLSESVNVAGENFIEFFSAPTDPNRIEHREIQVKLIDVEDKNCYATLRCQGKDGDWAYHMVSGNGGDWVGFESDKKGIHRNNGWGKGSKYRFDGAYTSVSKGELGDRTVQYYFDAAENAFYASTGWVSPSEETQGQIIGDLDNPDYYSDAWTGFPSGKVRVEITCGDYYAEKANFIILKLGDADLSGAYAEDFTAPTIEIDMQGYEEIPQAKVGIAYPTFKATASDDYTRNCLVETSVYKVTKTQKISVDVAKDGTFVPTTEGLYEVLYTARDYFGNETTESVYVTAKDQGIAPVLTIKKPETTYALVGERVYVSDYAFSGGIGDVAVKIQAVSEKETVEVSDGYFIPMQEGTYSVVYQATDFIGQSSTRYYNVQVDLGYNPVFSDAPVLPQYFISGSKYKLPEFYAINYAADGERVLANAKITDANGERAIVYGEPFTPVVANNLDCVTITYSAGLKSVDYEIPCVLAKDSSGKMRMENYFIGSGVSAQALSYGVSIAATQPNGEWAFAKKLLAKDFTIQFASVAPTTFNGLTLTLVDAENPSLAVVIRLIRSSNLTLVEVAGKQTAVSFNWNSDNQFLTLGISGSTLSVNGVSIGLKDAQGNAFTGFLSKFAYVKVAFEDAEIGSKYTVNSINGQLFSSNGADTLAPTMLCENDKMGGAFYLGEIADISAVVIDDVLSPYVTCTLMVEAPDHKPVTAVDGTKLFEADPTKEYQIKLEQYGLYQVTYIAVDENNQISELSMVINVIDSEAPEISLEDEYATEGKVGEEFAIAKATVTDNLSDEEDMMIYCVIVKPNGGKVVIDYKNDGRYYTPDEAGVYAVQFVAVDKIGNTSRVTYAVTVS